MKRSVCFLLIACMLCASLVSCNGGGAIGDGGDLFDGDWSSLDFEGATLTVSVSANDPDETTFGNSAVYMRGIDNAATSDPVQKKILTRNRKVCENLDMTIEYQETNWRWDYVLPHLEQLVAGDASDAPDVYNNDMYALFRAMMSGYLWNVTSPGKDAKGKEVKSYFDLDHECWYQEYMQGATFSKDKQYILVGDYNIDIIRWAWVLFVNVDLWDATFSNLPEEAWSYDTYDSACDYIAATKEWFYDDLIGLAGIAHIDGPSSTVDGKADLTDQQIGLTLNPVSCRIFTYGSGYSIFEWTKNGKTVGAGEGTPSMITDTTDLANVGLKFTELYNAKGVYNFPNSAQSSNEDCVFNFIKGKAVMATVTLGEMESTDMRNAEFQRGILPYPRYSRAIKQLTTIVHDQAEVSVILNNAKSFTLASAFLQHVNEESVEILNFYYDEVLKFKYNESRGARKMIDLVSDSVAPPFETLMNLHLFTEANVNHMFMIFDADAQRNSGSSLRSSYDGVRGALQRKLEELCDKFDKLD